MSFRRIFSIALALAIALFVSAPVFAQSLVSGDVTGTVTDPSGAVVPNATVTLKSIDQGNTITRTTNAQGFYRFQLLQPGPYKLTVTAAGFQSVTRDVRVAVGQATTTNAQLAISSATTTVEVTAAPGLVQTQNGNLSTTFSSQQIEQTPNPGNDLSYVAQTSPGAVMNTQAGYGNFASFGISGTSNLFTYNGMNENDPFLNLNNTGATNIQLGANDVREVTVVDNGYSGQYGGLAGANVNYVSKSGGNQFHGNVKYWWNGRILNANNFFNKYTSDPATITPRPFVNDNQWAWSIGGPIKKDNTFFFVNQEGLYVAIPTSVQVRVPSSQFQAATLANLGAVNPAEVPFYQKMFAIWNNAPGVQNAINDLPGGGCGTFTALGANVPCALEFQSNQGNKTHEWILGVRIDHNFSQNDRAFARFKTDRGVQATYTDPLNPVFNSTSTQPQYEGQLQETHAFGSSAVNQFIMAGSWYSAYFSPPDLAASLQAFPYRLRFSGDAFRYLGGINQVMPQGRNVTQYQFIDDLSLQKGRHALKFGINFSRNDVTDFVTSGSIGYSASETLGNFFNGVGRVYLQNFPQRNSQPIAVYQLGFYGQDEISVTQNFKLTLALRFDRYSNPVCQTDCFARFATSFDNINHDPNVPYNQVILTGQHQALEQLDKINIGPRIAFAWTPFGDQKTVLRGGFGIFYDAFPATIGESFANNPPVNNQFIVGSGPLDPALATSQSATAAAANASFLNQFASGGTLASISASNPNFAPPSFYNANGRIHAPRYQKWNLELQRAVGNSSSISLNYVGNHGIFEAVQNAGVNAFCDPILCAGDLGTGTTWIGLPTAAPDARFGTITEVNNGAVSNYNGLTLSWQSRFAHGFQTQVNYTWSHALDEISNGGFLQYNFNTNVSVLFPQDPTNLKRFNYGNADYDVRHYFSMNYSWDTPFKFSNGILNQLLGGWTIAGTVFARTGLPFTVLDSNAAGILSTYNYGNQVFGNEVATGGTIQCGTGSINTPCPAMINGFTAATTTWGNQRRNQVFGPHFFNTDLNLTKNFKIPGWESGRFGIGAQFYNILNHPNFDQPIQDVADPQFGQIILTANSPTSIYGAFLGGDASPRIIQLKAQITF